MDFLIIFAGSYLYFFVIVIALAGLYLTKVVQVKKSLLKLSILSFPLSLIIAKIVSLFIYDSRPFVTEKVTPLIPHAANNGFPSDHTLLTMTISAVFLIYNRKLGILMAILSIIVGQARVLAKIHQPIDIVGSIIIAFIATFISYLIIKKVKTINLFLDKVLSKFIR